MGNNKKIEELINIAILSEKNSNDPDTQVGCVLTDENFEIKIQSCNHSNSYNIVDVEKLKRPLKYKYIEHAERNAIYFAAKLGIKTNNFKMFLSKLFPCCDCARAIVESGIGELYCYEPDWNEEKYKEEFRISREILEENNVRICFLEKIV